jgi:hypothetical protein
MQVDPEIDGSIMLQPPWGPKEGMQTRQTFKIIVEASLALTGSARANNMLGGQLEGMVWTPHHEPTIYHVIDTNTALQALFHANFTNTTSPTPQDNVTCSFRALGAGVTKAIRDAALADRISPSSSMTYRVASQHYNRGRCLLKQQ